MNNKTINEEELRKLALEAAKKMIETIKKRELESEELILSDDYIIWLKNFTEKYPSFTDDEWFDGNEITYEDNKNVLKIGLLFNRIKRYARNNFIYSDKDREESYNIEYKGIGYTIGVTYGQGSFFFCERTTPTSDFISLLDIRENVERPNVRIIKERLEFLKEYLTKMLEENIPVEAIKETTQKVLQKNINIY